MPTPVAISHKFFGLIAISQYARFDTACSRPKTISDRYRPQRDISDPPASAPTMVAASPSTLFTVPTSVGVKPAPRIRKVVDKAPAKASPSLYSTISSNTASAPRRVKNSCSGSPTAARRLRGARATCSGSGASKVATEHSSIRPPIST
ncbi:hypothetical protein G6F62_014117 [Rhizopus arrhizus]|nr:hypothetical protein G6F62_014117 [Rhizopus arrhizus]